MKDKILFTMIEGDNNNINNNTGNIKTKRLYEQEAILCFKNWRKKAGALKDIKIICYAPTHNLPSSKTIQDLKKLNVEYIENYLPEVQTMEYGFFAIPLIGKLIEDMYPSSYLIHIDLDMNIIKPIPNSLFDNKIHIGQYDNKSAKDQRGLDKWDNPLDTGFTISPPNSNFYNIYWKEFKNLYFNGLYKSEPDWINQNCSLFFLEEYIADKLYNNKILDITPINYYQVGEGYVNVNELTDDNLKSVLFWHEHLISETDSLWDNTKTKQKITFFKRIRGTQK